MVIGGGHRPPLQKRELWGAQAASMPLPAACRQQIRVSEVLKEEVREGGTPSPTRETRALPRRRRAEREHDSSRSKSALPHYAGAPPRAPGSGGVTSGATTTCLGGFSGSIFSPPRGAMPGGGLSMRPCLTMSLICEPSRVSNSSSALAMTSSLSRLAVRICFALWYASSRSVRTSRSISSAVASL